MNPLSVFSTAWLEKLASVFGKTKIQTKILSAPVFTTGTTTLSELNFTGLTIGKWYTINLKLQSSGGTNTRAVHILHGARILDDSQTLSDNSENRIIYTFQATATTITYDVVTNATGIHGDGTERYTFAQLKEHHNYEATTQW